MLDSELLDSELAARPPAARRLSGDASRILGLKRLALGVSLALLRILPAHAEIPPRPDTTQIAESPAGKPRSRSLYISIPAYLYSTYSAAGIHGGYEWEKAFLRADLVLIEDFAVGKRLATLLYSLGVFLPQRWNSSIRIYEGVAFGEERGVENSFTGRVLFLNFLMGVELLPLGQCSFFMETGSGMAFLRKAGAFNGGTVIGGGIKYRFAESGKHP